MKQKKNSDNAIVLVFPVRIVQMLLAERVDRWIKVHNPLKKTLSLEAKENRIVNATLKISAMQVVLELM
jgi:hypothetical protein